MMPAIPWRIVAVAGLLLGLPAVPVVAETVIVVSRADCMALVAHRPDPGVDYRPGVDARGRPVAPADLGGAPAIVLAEEIEIPITVELAPRFGLPPVPDLYKGEAEIGRARVRLEDGRAWFDGRPLTGEQERILALLCRERGTAPRR